MPSSSRRTPGCARTSPTSWVAPSSCWRPSRVACSSGCGEAVGGGEGHWLERIMTPAQRETFDKTQALMSLLEGYSNHVMNAAGAQILPNFDEIHDRFERRGERRGALERAIMRLTGLDLKMEQYAAGERFADAVIARPRAATSSTASGPDPKRCRRSRDPRPRSAWIARIERARVS